MGVGSLDSLLLLPEIEKLAKLNPSRDDFRRGGCDELVEGGGGGPAFFFVGLGEDEIFVDDVPNVVLVEISPGFTPTASTFFVVVTKSS